MITLENERKIASIIENDQSGDLTNELVMSIITQLKGVGYLENDGNARDVISQIIQQLDVINNVIDTETPYRLPNAARPNRELARRAGMQGQEITEINNDNAELLLDNSLWAIVSILIYAELKGFESTIRLLRRSSIYQTSLLAKDKLLEGNVRLILGEEPTARREPAAVEEPVAVEEPAVEEPAAVEEPEAIGTTRQTNGNTFIYYIGEFKRHYMNVYDELESNEESYIQYLQEEQNISVRKNKLGLDLREVRQDDDIISSIISKEYLENIISNPANINKAAMSLRILYLLFNKPEKKFKVSADGYTYETESQESVIGITHTINKIREIMLNLIFYAYSTNKIADLIREVNLDISVQESAEVYNRFLQAIIEKLYDDFINVNEGREKLLFDILEEAIEESYFDKIINNYNKEKVIKDMKTQIEKSMEIKDFENQKKLVPSGASFTLRGW